MAHVAIDRVSKRFGEFRALDQVSLAIARGEFLTLLGPSGCGKTTLLRAIAGFHRQDDGTITIGERVIDDVPAHQRDTGMVFQNYAIFPHMTVFENVAYGLRARKVAKGQIETRVRGALGRVQLGNLADRYPAQLSGGQKQRVGLARALVIEPSVLLMDEPLSNLDAKLRVAMRQDIRLVQQDLKITTIYVTHDQEEALAVSDRIAVMAGGRILQVGTPKEICDDPRHEFVADFIGSSARLAATFDGARVKIDGGPAVEPARAIAAPAGTALVVSIRCESLDPEPADAPAGTRPFIAGKLVLASYLGPRSRVSIEAEGITERLEAEVPSDHPALNAAPGTRLRLAFAASAMRVFARDDGRRLA